MVIAIATRDVAAGAGALLVFTAAVSVIGTLIVPRPIGSWLTRLVDQVVNGAFRTISLAADDGYHHRVQHRGACPVGIRLGRGARRVREGSP